MTDEKQKRTYFPSTTAQQRCLLFQAWEETGIVTQACRKAHVSRGTFYKWKPRFEVDGYSGLELPRSRAPGHPHQTPVEIQEQVIKMRRENPGWGKRRIADELGKGNNWVPIVSPNTVRRILRDAGLWTSPQTQVKKRGSTPVSRTAEAPGETLNVDLCFVPETHADEIKLPAVSGSSGRLVVEPPKDEADEASYPGQVFANKELDYASAMREFVAASEAQVEKKQDEMSAEEAEKASLLAEKQALRQEEEALRVSRRQGRQHRKQEDAAWEILKGERRAQQQVRKAQREANEKPPWGSKKAQDEHWHQLRKGREAQRKQREEEDQLWRRKRLDLRKRAQELIPLPIVTAWIAILVVTDNCTRQCPGLPIFVAGPTLTAEMVVEALRFLLPPDLQFLISDRGTHFTAKVFRQLAENANFIHVLIARHRPQSNGIAERFVRTLKEWLKDKSWQGDQDLNALVQEFLPEYNDRPHQGLPIPGLSPNEFAKRLCASSS